MRVLLLSLILSVSSQAYAQTNQNDTLIPNEIVGNWQFERASVESRPCSSGSISYRKDGTFISRSGEQIMKGKYIAEPYQYGYLLTTKFVNHNGEPNCQGYSAEYVIKNNVPKSYVEVEENTLRQYFGTTTSESYIEFIRLEERNLNSTKRKG